MKRAFTRAGYLRKDVQKILHEEGNRIRKFVARNSDICPRDLAFLLVSEVHLACALQHATMKAQGKEGGRRD